MFCFSPTLTHSRTNVVVVAVPTTPRITLQGTHVWMKERERGENDKQKEEEGGG